MNERDRLAADLRVTIPVRLIEPASEWWDAWADRLLALGWTRLDEDRLGRALRLVEDAGTIVLLGTDTRTDEDGLPLRNDYSGVDAECAVAIVKAYQEDAP